MSGFPNIFAYGGGSGGGSRLHYCIAGQSGARTNVANAGVLIWDTDILDASGLHDASANKERFVADASGIWRISAQFRRTSGSAGDFVCVTSSHSGDTGAYSRWYFTTTGVENCSVEWEGTLSSTEYFALTHNGNATNNYGGDGSGSGEFGWVRFERLS